MMQRDQRQQRGAILILAVFILPLFVFMAAMAVDVAWMQLVRTELRTATDSAARAGAKQLSMSQSSATARAAALDAASRNTVAGSPMQLAASDVVFGTSAQTTNNSRFRFTPGANPANGVQITARKTNSSPAGSVPLFFGSAFGVSQFEPEQTATSTVLDRDLCLVLDRSGSMRGSKIRALKSAVTAFFAELNLTFPQEQVSLVSYSTNSTTESNLTLDYTSLQGRSDNMNASGLTAIGLALRDGIQAVTGPSSRAFAVPTIVLMTDGRHNRGVEPIVHARIAKQRGIVVHTITFGRGADFGRMRAVANETGGTHFHADTAGDLKEIFQTIARTLPVLLTE